MIVRHDIVDGEVPEKQLDAIDHIAGCLGTTHIYDVPWIIESGACFHDLKCDHVFLIDLAEDCASPKLPLAFLESVREGVFDNGHIIADGRMKAELPGYCDDCIENQCMFFQNVLANMKARPIGIYGGLVKDITMFEDLLGLAGVGIENVTHEDVIDVVVRPG
eukprot:TRINITY_DN7984_c0_g2_i2.p1 TRINITY_DN7984_c0_g2~~TRINITY_DN7984_c0_g2_i2.p1  ORF type:complete len:163 (-),score=70.69 TRINITY_DN7984_c0_g2_i2:132-620(-)